MTFFPKVQYLSTKDRDQTPLGVFQDHQVRLKTYHRQCYKIKTYKVPGLGHTLSAFSGSVGNRTRKSKKVTRTEGFSAEERNRRAKYKHAGGTLKCRRRQEAPLTMNLQLRSQLTHRCCPHAPGSVPTAPGSPRQAPPGLLRLPGAPYT